MKTDMRLFSVVVVVLLSLDTGLCDKSDDCTEVGYARSAGILLPQAYDEVLQVVLQRWEAEDEAMMPPYTRLQGSLKNVTRAAYLLEEVSKEVLVRIRKTRVGKRCRPEWLLRGVEKHVKPLVNLDQSMTDKLGLVMSFRCMVGSPYPNVDGTCISEESPDMGAIGAKFLRLLPSRPGLDGFSLRSSVSDAVPLPSARSVAVVLRQYLQQPTVTPLFSGWAHFIQQDIFNIPESPLAEGVDCCQSPDAEDCASIPVPDTDPQHQEMECINFRRAARAQAILGHRESFSVVSTYLDATPLYGPTNEVAFKYKTGFFGYLKGGERLEEPISGSPCHAPDSWDGCFEADEHISPSVRALLMLEHNRIADSLAELNPHFDDALLYNEARRILIASYASMTYGQYLLVLLGNETVTKHLLYPGAEGPAATYIKDVNPGVLTSFATAAFRNPAMATEWRSDQVGREELFGSQHYDSVAEQPYQDLLAMDVQRGRDHGLPNYLSWRRFCDPGLVLDSWEDLKQIFPEGVTEALKEVYSGEMENLDAMVALLELPLEGGVAGKTYTCIMADQFARLRTGNRLYWEHPGGMLTKEQQDELKKANLASLLCSNLPVQEVPANPLLPVSKENPLMQCSDVIPLNLTHWTDTSLIESMKDVKKEQPPTKGTKTNDSVKDGHDNHAQSSEGIAADQTPPIAEQISSTSSSKVATVRVHGDGEPTEKMAASGVDSGQRLTTEAKNEL